MARKTPALEIYDNEVDFYYNGKLSFDFCVIPPDGNKFWFDWLQDANHKSFRVVSKYTSFTARKELRGNIAYWYGYKKIAKKLHNCYIGESLATTPDLLCDIARHFLNIMERDSNIKSK